ncbi:biotin synthase [Cyanidiococcus yangmingshanensis]|uniref:biotin synthase n=1 Tax=Cyanidiococcus yangmingshanensis TaxID=2690220 RepID=A0A7J7IDV3_9RHOD|nr:biotin synthase [Cyanidiococcus yangmingshanensis]
MRLSRALLQAGKGAHRWRLHRHWFNIDAASVGATSRDGARVPLPSSNWDKLAASAIAPYVQIRSDWSRKEVEGVYWQPLNSLVFQAALVHRVFFDPGQVQKCTLLSIKTGGCPETCKYCSQSSSYRTGVKAEPLMQLEDVLREARLAKERGSTRFCMGAAWRGPSQVGPRQFQRVLEMVRGVRALGLEVCATLGLLNAEQAKALKEAGLTAYNHNLDTSREYYDSVISSRRFEDRLDTLTQVRAAGIQVCCGGILGLGESHEDRVSLLHTLATMERHPESVPINMLVPNKGTPLEGSQPVQFWELCRMVAATRILMPASMVRLSAGRISLSEAEQMMCFMAGANSIFTGDKLLTTPNNELSQDDAMFRRLGLSGQSPFMDPRKSRLEQSEASLMQ